MAQLTITYTAPNALTRRVRNPRVHSKKQVLQIAESIKEFGFTAPILMDAKGTIIAGHGRLEAAKLLGMRTVPTIRLDQMTEAQIRAYVIADNRLAENAGWDDALLALEFQELQALNLDFDLTVTGFDAADIDIRISSLAEDDDSLDDFPAVDTSCPPVSRLGDPPHSAAGDDWRRYNRNSGKRGSPPAGSIGTYANYIHPIHTPAERRRIRHHSTRPDGNAWRPNEARCQR